MSSASGIQATDELAAALAELRISASEGTPARVVKVVIENEKLVEATRVEGSGDWEQDYESIVPPLLEDADPCYIFFRLDATDANGAYRWLFICYVPDNAHIRKKMLYASTRASVRREFGDQLIQDELYGSVKSDVTLEGYRHHLRSADAPAPLRADEREMQEIKKAEAGAHISTSSKHAVASGVAFPLTPDAEDAISSLLSGETNYVQLKIDTQNETVTLAQADDTDTHKLAQCVPSDSPRYHMLAYPHDKDGEAARPIFFIYSCPGYNCPVKERMLYSSCKSHVITLAEEKGLSFARKLEVSDAEDLTHESLHTDLYPPPKVEEKKFLKPAAPGRGARRLHRDRSNESVNSISSQGSAR